MLNVRDREKGNGMKKEILILFSILLSLSVTCGASLNAVKAASNSITINYNFSYPVQITGNTPPGALSFMVLNMTIKDNGYSGFSTDPTYFAFNETGDQYGSVPLNYDANATNALWATKTLNSGDTYTGLMVFEYNPSPYELGFTVPTYNGTQNYNVVWNYDQATMIQNFSPVTINNSAPTQAAAPSSTVAPTSTTNSSPATPEFPSIAILAAFLGVVLVVVTLLTVRKRKVSNS